MKPIPTIRRFAAACPMRSRTLRVQISRLIADYCSRCVPVLKNPSHTTIVCELGFPPPPRRTTDAPAALPTPLAPSSLLRQAASTKGRKLSAKSRGGENSTAGLFNNQFHSGLRRNETSGFGLCNECSNSRRWQKLKLVFLPNLNHAWNLLLLRTQRANFLEKSFKARRCKDRHEPPGCMTDPAITVRHTAWCKDRCTFSGRQALRRISILGPDRRRRVPATTGQFSLPSRPTRPDGECPFHLDAHRCWD
jgi:hypothetical protein